MKKTSHPYGMFNVTVILTLVMSVCCLFVGVGLRISFPVYHQIPNDNKNSEGASNTSSKMVHAKSAQDLPKIFAYRGYQLGDIRKGKGFVPRLHFVNMPANFDRFKSLEHHKVTFLKTLLPMILQVNEQIQLDRHFLLSIIERQGNGEPIMRHQQQRLKRLAEKYKTSPRDLKTLLVRIDCIPPSLALSQGIEESGWGTSRMAILKNSPFGESTSLHTFSKDGFKTLSRLKTFSNLQEAIKSYIHTINTHNAYKELRALRALTRQAGRILDGYTLAGGLKRYSELGIKYVKKIQFIIQKNQLYQLDHAALTPYRH